MGQADWRWCQCNVSGSSVPDCLPPPISLPSSSPFSTALPDSQEHQVLKQKPLFPSENTLASGLAGASLVMVSILFWARSFPWCLGFYLMGNMSVLTCHGLGGAWSQYKPQVLGPEGHLGRSSWEQSQRFASGSEPLSFGLVAGYPKATHHLVCIRLWMGHSSLSTLISFRLFCWPGPVPRTFSSQPLSQRFSRL